MNEGIDEHARVIWSDVINPSLKLALSTPRSAASILLAVAGATLVSSVAGLTILAMILSAAFWVRREPGASVAK